MYGGNKKMELKIAKKGRSCKGQRVEMVSGAVRGGGGRRS
jgi:hypothetical protein